MINSYEEFEEAVEIFGLIGVENRADIKKKYLKLSKKFHPDMPNGDIKKFQQLNKAYTILTFYIDNFKFRFSKDEFKNQYPFLINSHDDWLSK